MAATITFRNDFTINEALEMFDNLKDAVSRNDEVCLDLNSVNRLDAAALQMLVAAKKEGERIGHKIAFRISETANRMLLFAGIQL